MENIFGAAPEVSPGTVAFLSNFFIEDDERDMQRGSFSQLLAGAIAAPAPETGAGNDRDLVSLKSKDTKTETMMHNSKSSFEVPMLSSIRSSAVSRYENSSQLAAPVIDKAADDGYNWRKYGQKVVKGCEYPRNYYKCTHPKCPVKKQVERTLDGRVTEIIYKGKHNHTQPLPSRRRNETATSHLNRLLEAKKEPEYNDVVDPNSDLSDEGADNEPELKKRNMEKEPIKSSEGKEPTNRKIVVRTRSEVDLLDDGYRWRKYGQKAVKGNPNPRSYYKCTQMGCNVRKQIERASTDPRDVITTYEGKHNHNLPVARI